MSPGSQQACLSKDSHTLLEEHIRQSQIAIQQVHQYQASSLVIAACLVQASKIGQPQSVL